MTISSACVAILGFQGRDWSDVDFEEVSFSFSFCCFCFCCCCGGCASVLSCFFLVEFSGALEI